MKKIKTIMSVLCVIALLTSCGTKPAQNLGANEKKSFTYWCAIAPSLSAGYKSLNELPEYQELEKRTGIHMDFIHPNSNVNEQFKLLLATGEYPDIIEYSWGDYPGGPEKAIEDKVIISLNKQLAKNAPNFKKLMDENDDYRRGSITDNGTYFGFPNLATSEYRSFGGLIIRKDWLDELGLDVPTTISDWENVLRAFKEKKGATSPFTGNTWTVESLSAFTGAFGIGRHAYAENGKVKYGPMEPQFKEWLRMMNKWYSDGLLDKDYTTNTDNIIDAKIITGNAGAFAGYIGGHLGKYIAMTRETEPKFDLVGVLPPISDSVTKNYLPVVSPKVSNPFLAITVDCADPETAMKWADYLYTDEGRLLINFGVEGVSYNMVNGYPTYVDDILHNPDGLSINEAMDKYFRVSTVSPGLKSAAEYLDQYYQLDQQKDAFKNWSTYAKDCWDSGLYSLTPTIEESEEKAAIETEIKTYTSEMILKFIQGTESFDNYDNFIATMKKLRADRYVELLQSSYDRYLKR